MAQQPNTASQEYLLLDYAQRLERHRDGRRGVHVHLSRLKPQNRREHHIRIALNTLDDFVQTFEGQSFLLGNGDLIFVVKGANLQQMDDAVMRMRYLFSDDPLTQADADSEGHGRFATLYNIEGQYAKFLELCERVFEEERARQKRLQQMAEQTGETFEDARRPLKPEQLGRLEEFLERADLSSVFRRQAVCVVHKESPPKPIFNELFISIYDLAKTVLPDVNLASNRWLFQHLTQTLDRRVLKMLARADDSSLHSSFSINVNVATLLSPEFLEFDSSLRMGSRGTLVVELQILDILSDYSGFIFARDFVREKGYRICLDGITPDLIRFVDRQYMEVDLVKLSSDSVFDTGGNTETRAAIAQQVERVGKGRVILSRCDNEAMIRTGQSMGITMFQGRYLDAVLQQIARAKNPPAPRMIRR
ncbi:MAG: EAL domain-containing protein [Alphaproteobacteria bacterium]|nr:EAL domain-containing protein [Alphaproteobacteria bacterium]